MLKEEKKDVGILLDTTTYSGLSFEISKDMEQDEVAATAVVTVNSSDGDIGVLDLSEGKLVHVQEKYSSKIKPIVLKQSLCLHLSIWHLITPLTIKRF
jgi:hypothetical protein